MWAWLLARIIIPRSSGIYFSMITLAFAQVIFFITYRWSDLTGGEDGMQNVARPTPTGAGGCRDSDHFYWFAAVVRLRRAVRAVLRSCLAVRQRAARDPRKQAARALPGLRRQQIPRQRVRPLGAFPAIAGWLWTYYQQAINPDAGSVEYSGNVVMMSMLGGIQSFMGPILGASVYWEIQNNVSQLTKYWEAWIGIVFVVVRVGRAARHHGLWDDVRHYGVVTRSAVRSRAASA